MSAVQSAVDAANEQLSRVEQIKRFSVIDGEWHPDGDELTPMPKLSDGRLPRSTPPRSRRCAHRWLDQREQLALGLGERVG